MDDGWTVVQAYHSVYAGGSWADPTGGMSTLAVLKSSDGGATWRGFRLGSERGEVRAIAVSPLDSNLVLAGGCEYTSANAPYSRMFRASDTSLKWTDVSMERFKADSMCITGIVFDPAVPTRVLAASSRLPSLWSWNPLPSPGRGVYISTDAGLTWVPPKQPQIDASCLVADPLTPGRFFLGSTDGVWMSLDHGESWAQIDNGLPPLRILSMSYDPVNKLLYAGTDGGGVARLDVGSMVSVPAPGGASAPSTFVLRQNYPNPFNPTTTIEFGVPETGHYRLAVYTMLGQETAVLADGLFRRGYHTARFNARGLSSGVYFYRLTGGPAVLTRSMLLVR